MSQNSATADARAKLLRCAMDLLEERGHEGLSVRRVAERAGLSSGAPYYHFPDRRALLIDMALEGFRALDLAGRTVLKRKADEPAEALHELASSFLDFSAAHPKLIDLMYESELTRPIDDALVPYRVAFDMVVHAIKATRPGAAEDKAMIRAVAFWTSLFGLSRVLRQQMMDPFEATPGTSWRVAILDEIVAAATSPS